MYPCVSFVTFPPPIVTVTEGPKKPKSRWDRWIKTIRLLAILWIVKLVITLAIYGFIRFKDVEKLEIDAAVRDSVAKATGGKFVTTSVGTTYYNIAGPESAPVVVLAAGASVPSYIWQPTFDTLKANGYRVISYDYIGRGWSDRPDSALTQEIYVQQLLELLDSLHVTKPITLAGLSYGGTVITSFAAEHPARVGALIYADPAIIRGRTLVWYRRWEPVADLFMQWESRTWASGQLGDFLHPEQFPDWPDRYKPQMRYKGFRYGRYMDIVGNLDTDMLPVLEQVGKHPRPVIAIWGKQDETVPIARSEALLKALPHARLIAIDSAGHLPHWEQPAVTHAALLEFLRANHGKRAGLDQ
jgi:pimeloyl-ACP methyl ester carboxylesterase